MLKVTLDRNCLISLQNKDGEYKELREIITLHKNNQIDIFVCAISASEYQIDGSIAKNYNNFIKFLKSIDCGKLEAIKPMAYYGIFYWGHAFNCGNDEKEFEKKIHDVLFPNLEFKYKDFCKTHNIDPNVKLLNKKWLNPKADVQHMWSHINSKHDIFITQDKNFLKKQKCLKLIQLGARQINTPKNALKTIRRNST